MTLIPLIVVVGKLAPHYNIDMNQNQINSE